MHSSTDSSSTAPGLDLDRPVPLRQLVYLPEADEVTIGSPETDTYAVFPADGAELVRMLAEGLTPREAAENYRTTRGESVDIADLIETLVDLDLVRPGGDDAAAGPVTPVRWQRLGRVVFSPPALVGYALVTALAVAEMIRVPELVPRVDNLFFSSSYTLVVLMLFVGQVPLLALHEAFHALAGRRLRARGSRSAAASSTWCWRPPRRAGRGTAPEALPAHHGRHAGRRPGDRRAHPGRRRDPRHRRSGRVALSRDGLRHGPAPRLAGVLLPADRRLRPAQYGPGLREPPRRRNRRTAERRSAGDRKAAAGPLRPPPGRPQGRALVRLADAGRLRVHPHDVRRSRRTDGVPHAARHVAAPDRPGLLAGRLDSLALMLLSLAQTAAVVVLAARERRAARSA
ncbi:hypothetical protein ACFQ0M_04500 [Kitasatospora aburaviensis]